MLYTHPIREWEGQAPHTYGDIIHSSSVYLHSGYTKVTIQQNCFSCFRKRFKRSWIHIYAYVQLYE